MSRTTDFDKEDILNKAMTVFWEKGYENTTLKDLMNATGLLKGSLYNTFSSKENLFLLCLERYGHNSRLKHYEQGDPKSYLKNFFNELVEQGAKKDFTKGCLIMNSCMEFSYANPALAKKAKALFSATEKNLKRVLEILVNGSKSESEIEQIKVAFLTAAFSIREISKFRKDKAFLKQIANNALKEVNLKI